MEEIYNAADNGILDWDSFVEEDSQEFEFIPLVGEYKFRVEKFERGRFNGSAKIPGCPKASLTLSVTTDEGRVVKVFTDLILHKSLEWKLSAFFRSVGLKKHGEKMQLCFDQAIGAEGRARFKVREYTKKDGTPGKVNDVDTFLDPADDGFKTVAASATPWKDNGNW